MDYLKAFFALCVIAIHTQPLSYTENKAILMIYDLTTSLAVPFFFAATGFLGGKKWNYVDYIVKTRRKYIRMYLIGNFIYFPVTIWGFIYNDYGVVRALIHWLRGFFLLGEQFYSWPLWYLLSIIIGTFIFQIIAKRNIKRAGSIFIAFITITIAYILNHAEMIHSEFSKIVSMTIGNGRLLTGSCFMLLGKEIRCWEISRKTSFKILGGVL